MQRISERISFTQTADRLVLVISNNISPFWRYFFLIISIVIVVGVGVSLYDMSMDVSFRKPHKMIIGIGSISAGVIWLNKTFKKEIVEVDKTNLSLRTQTLFSNRIKIYSLSDIAHFRFAGGNTFTEHALKVNDFDYLGAQTAEKQLQHVIKDGTLEFFCKGKYIRFGLNVTSWDAEEIITHIEKFSGNNLQLDDSMEKLLDELKNEDENSDDL